MIRTTFAAALTSAVVLAAAAAPARAEDVVAKRDMLKYCAGMAAEKFGTRPQYIEMGELTALDNGAHVAHGVYDGETAFSCRFGQGDRFRWVRTDEEKQQANASDAPTERQVKACEGEVPGGGNVRVVSQDALKPGAWELVLASGGEQYGCDVEADGKVTYFEKLR